MLERAPLVEEQEPGDNRWRSALDRAKRDCRGAWRVLLRLRRVRCSGLVAGLCACVVITLSACDAVDIGSVPADKKAEFLKRQTGRAVTPAQASRHDSPIYWLGPRYRGFDLNEIRIRKDGSSSVTYGEVSCGSGASDGCSWDFSLDTRPRDREDFPTKAERTPGQWGGPICFNRIGQAVAVSCLNPETEDGEETLLAGKESIYVYGYDPRDLRSLTPPRGRRPPPPTRLTCPEIAGMPRWAQRKVPSHLRPAKRCP